MSYLYPFFCPFIFNPDGDNFCDMKVPYIDLRVKPIAFWSRLRWAARTTSAAFAWSTKEARDFAAGRSKKYTQISTKPLIDMAQTCSPFFSRPATQLPCPRETYPPYAATAKWSFRNCSEWRYMDLRNISFKRGCWIWNCFSRPAWVVFMWGLKAVMTRSWKG